MSLAAETLARRRVVYSAATASRLGSGRTTSRSIGMPSVPMIMTIWVSGTRAAMPSSVCENADIELHPLRTASQHLLEPGDLAPQRVPLRPPAGRGPSAGRALAPRALTSMRRARIRSLWGSRSRICS